MPGSSEAGVASRLVAAALRGLLADTRPLADPHFRRLWQANIVTVIGAQVTVVAVPAQIYAITGSSAYVGLTGVFGLVPLVVFGLWGGALADAMDRRTLLIITTVGLIVTSGLFYAQAALGNTDVWLLLGLFSVQQAFFAVNQPTRSAILPKLLRPELLPAANSLNMTVFQAGAIAGPLVAGALIPFVGFSWLYLIDTVTLFATLGAVIGLPRLPVEGAVTSPGLRSVIDGLPLPAAPAGAADVLRRRHHRDGVRDAPGAVPGDGAHQLRRPGGRRPRVRPAVRGDPGRRGAGRGVLGVGLPGRAPGPRRHRVDPRLGPGDGRLRARGRASPAGRRA